VLQPKDGKGDFFSRGVGGRTNSRSDRIAAAI